MDAVPVATAAADSTDAFLPTFSIAVPALLHPSVNALNLCSFSSLFTFSSSFPSPSELS